MYSSARRRTIAGIVLATLAGFIPPLIFEKYTFYLYLTGGSDFFLFSGNRLWFDIIWFVVAGVISTALLRRRTKLVILPPIISATLFIVAAYVSPLCELRECYISSIDGLAPLRDFLLLASLGVVTSAVLLRDWSSGHKLLDNGFQFLIPMLVGYALSFFPIIHIFAGVTMALPLNYFQWFLAGAPAGLAGSMMLLDKGPSKRRISRLAAGCLGVILGLALAVEIPCEGCGGYTLPVLSIVTLAALFSVPAALVSGRKLERMTRHLPSLVTIATIVVVMILLWGFFTVSDYEASVVNSFVGINQQAYSPLEVGSSFVYSGGYLAIPRVVSQAVEVNISFGNSTISQVQYPENFLAAGVGDQSPNCCKDGLDLAYRADAIEFDNGTEAVIARAWWACDVNMACGGYSWQQLLHFGSAVIPRGSLSHWVQLEMNWTSPTLIQWFYRIDYNSTYSSSWVAYSNFTPPKIQNHYWDAGLYYVGEGNQPTMWAYFYQFGVSSAYPLQSNTWHVYFQCPSIVLNGTWTCIPKAGYVNGAHSFWKVIYTFGGNYPGVTFSYMGNHKVAFFYNGTSPKDDTTIW